MNEKTVLCQLDYLRKLCEEQQLRLTESRMAVYKVLVESDVPLAAYDVLEAVKVVLPQAKPPTVYRALDFLHRLNVVHRIETTNRFWACPHPEHRHEAQFLICSKCNQVTEFHLPKNVEAVLLEAAQTANFEVSRRAIELYGHCADCKP